MATMFVPFIIYILIVFSAGIISLFINNKNSIQKSIAPLTICGSSIVILAYLLSIFKNIIATDVTVFNWQMPYATMKMGIDPLTAFMLIPLFILISVTSLYGWKYLDGHKLDRTHWLFYSLLAIGMVLVLLSRDAILFIFSWEIMSVSSFFLVISDKTNSETLRGGLIYFVTAHIGAALMFAAFFILASASGSFEFSSWSNLHLPVMKANLIFVLALLGFGTKAGFIPLHVWLPLAHPAAPSHVSALMSGIMIKMGIYAILRILTFITPYQTWWGITIIIIGVISGVWGVLFAIGQHDIKKLLAYHSVENIGIIMLGMGIGIIGVSHGNSIIAFFGFAGALLHILNHAMFKGLLFMGAGAIIRQTGTGEIDKLGGLIRKMPLTAILFIIGSIAISGLPFFNGFISELMIYLSSIFGVIELTSTVGVFMALLVGMSLAIIGGLAIACFTKVIGTVFLGEPRTKFINDVKEVPLPMIIGMAILALICIFIGLGSYFILPSLIITPIAVLTNGADIDTSIVLMKTITKNITYILLLGTIVFAAIFIIYAFLSKRSRKNVKTWGCGYSLPNNNMQYTSSSFAEPIITYFSFSLNSKKKLQNDHEIFPQNKWYFKSFVNDWILTKIYEPLIKTIEKFLKLFRWFQNGKSGNYVLYIAITLILIIIWKFL